MLLTMQINLKDMCRVVRLSALALFVTVVAAFPIAAQEGADSLRLGDLRAAAAEQDPRAVLPELLTRASALRIGAIRAQRLPQLTLGGQATVQSDVASLPTELPRQDTQSPPHEQFRAQAEAEWTFFDGGRTRRLAEAERARLGEELAGVRVTLYQLREATTEAFFAAILSGARADVLRLAAEDLAARLRVVREQANAGAALRADVAALEAERIRIVQQGAEAEAARAAALAVLADLTGAPVDPDTPLALPDLHAEVHRALAMLSDERLEGGAPAGGGRPELVRFARAAARAEAEARAREVQTRPTVGLFGEAGVGRPGPFDFLSDEVAEYGIAGVRVRWPLFDGGRARREAEALRVQAEIAQTEAAAFVRQTEREVEDERADLARLAAALAADREVVALREEVLRVTRRQLDEGVVLPDLYTDRLTDLAEARLTLARHRIERAEAQARLLSALGRFPEPRPPLTDAP